jgi:glycosyltransferase involved in cell wall biosynthesis
MRIDIICNDGSPLGVVPSTIYGDDFRTGVGGSELALLTMAQHWNSHGHDVVLYNNPWTKTNLLDQRSIAMFDPKKNRDVLIIFRSPNQASYNAKGKKIWWSCDQHTVGDFHAFGNTVDQIVTISEFHRKYFQLNYGLQSIVIDLPVRVQDYDIKNYKGDPDYLYLKVPNRMIFTSVPDRGLDILARCYPRIKQRIPGASLVITSDYRLWGTPTPNNERFKRDFLGMKDVEFLGAVPRERLIREQYKAEIHPYSCVYSELFCYSIAEAQYTYALPITSTVGAVDSTNGGIKITGDPRRPEWQANFINVICSQFEDRNTLESFQIKVGEYARRKFDIDRISTLWDTMIFNDL